MPNSYKLLVLRKERKAAGITLAQMAHCFELTGTKSRESVSDWERGRSVPRAYHRPQFIDYLGNTLGLRTDLEKFQAIWDVLVEEWEWEPISEDEWQEHFGDKKQLQQPITTLSSHDRTAPSSLPMHNLPSPVTSFIGRTSEVSQLKHLLTRARLVTLTGPGGSGKTRLALHLTAMLLEHYSDGIWFVDLAPVDNPALVLSAIARVLGITERAPEQPLSERLAAYLRQRHIFLLLDNFEHLVFTAPQISALLKAAPHLTVLVTSRVRLHISGEHEYTVAPLPLPDPEAVFDVLSQNTAVKLFVERAQAVNFAFTLSPDNVSSVAEICARVDGLPLAIELAAARSKRLSPEKLLTQFSSRLDLGAEGSVDVPRRHYTLRSMIEWSYNLLEIGEQTLFRRLAVFVGGCTMEAVETVCNATGDLAFDVHHGLDILVDHSLLRQEVGADSELRFGMLETVREYALERLEESREEVQRQHAHYYLSLAQQAEPELYGANQGIWRVRLESELANFRAALHWLDKQAEIESGLQLASSLQEFWDREGYLSEGREWLEKFLAKSTLPSHSPVSASAQASALLAAGILADNQADDARAQVCYKESLKLFRKIKDYRGTAEALTGLGGIAVKQGDFSKGQAYWEKSLELHRTIDNRNGITGLLNNLGGLLVLRSEYERAREMLEESLILYQQTESQNGIAMTCLNLGSVALYQSDYQRGRQLYKQSLALFYELRNKRGLAYALEGLGMLHDAERQYTETAQQAAQIWAVAAVLRMEAGVPLSANERDELEQAQSLARDRIGEATWVAAWASGETLTLEQVVAYAMKLESRKV